MIYLGADHGGFELKEHIKLYLKESGFVFEDLGNKIYDKEDDYTDYAFPVAIKVGNEDDPKKSWKDRIKGLLFCRSSGGMIIAANKVKNVRAVSVFDEKSAKHSREHNDANIIALSGDWTDSRKAEKIIRIWLETEFSKEERHERRLDKIIGYEKKRHF